ncbi:threonine ammonia-lyase, biosynthetic [Candidatus Kinetoplastidibacterium galati]|uniref:L-threonine dehydratase n=1 Tax=Candidatus Kinetoplastidibacterium galati TCC219 TaxID=1208921 RepID=M1L9Z7_9PROT|nr:threonine ammonia-lyase, biosynthetic [Candidatus Kinetoplastibacterium galatii]AGF49343.1 threonine dehydratase [Candidatus Kinetoplastibacterium galatii TCC219]
MPIDYLKRILTSKVYDVAIETKLDPTPLLSKRMSNNLLLKREDTQAVFSFKLRGAYNKMANLSKEALSHGVIAASAGNHAQGVALSATRLGCRAVIVMPTTSPQLKIDAVRRLGGEVVLAGESYTDAYNHALLLEKEEKLTFVHPFDDPDVIAGQGTVGMEILHQHPDPIEAIFVAVGGGGLIAGVAAYIKQLRPEIKIIGVQTTDSDAMLRSIKAGKRVHLKDVGLFSDGTAVKLVGTETFKLTKQYVDEFIVVNTDSICAAIKDVFQETRVVLEPAGAMSVAAAKQYVIEKNIKGKTLIAISCGANMNFDRLRFVAERADVGEMREAVFAVTIPEQRGSFKNFCQLIDKRNVTEFNYRISDSEKAHVFVGLQISSSSESDEIAEIFRQNKFDVLDLTYDEMAKSHLRHMVGGKSNLSDNEILYRFEFPERPGALMNFLNTMDPEWNISLFHYRNHGADYGQILIGIQVPSKDRKLFKEFLTELSYPYWDETNNPAYSLFL